MENKSLVKNGIIKDKIIFIQDQKVILDFHLAELYGVETRVLKQQVRRNLDRFPADFMFQLSKREWTELITICDKLGDLKFTPSLPFAFTEQGVAMLSSVLRSPKAIEVNIAIIRTFVKLRQMMESSSKLKTKIEEMEKKYDEQFKVIFQAIKSLIGKKTEPRKKIGFRFTKDE
jgi:hypothetical protein